MLSKVVRQDSEALAALDLKEVSTADKTDIMGQVTHARSNSLFSMYQPYGGVEACSVVRHNHGHNKLLNGLPGGSGRPVRDASKLDISNLFSPNSFVVDSAGVLGVFIVTFGVFAMSTIWHFTDASVYRPNQTQNESAVQQIFLNSHCCEDFATYPFDWGTFSNGF